MPKGVDTDAKINRLGDIFLQRDTSESEAKEAIMLTCQLAGHLFKQLDRIADALDAIERGR